MVIITIDVVVVVVNVVTPLFQYSNRAGLYCRQFYSGMYRSGSTKHTITLYEVGKCHLFPLQFYSKPMLFFFGGQWRPTGN